MASTSYVLRIYRAGRRALSEVRAELAALQPFLAYRPDDFACLTDDLAPTVFDFECCGPGFRAWNLATYRWSTRRQEDMWSAYLRGYAERRPLQDADAAAVPIFVAVREIWLLGARAANARDWGTLGVEERIDSGLAFLREWREGRPG